MSDAEERASRLGVPLPHGGHVKLCVVYRYEILNAEGELVVDSDLTYEEGGEAIEEAKKRADGGTHGGCGGQLVLTDAPYGVDFYTCKECGDDLTESQNEDLKRRAEQDDDD